MTYQEEQYAKQTLIQLIKGLNWFDIPNHLKEIFKRITTQITNLTIRVEILENGNTTEYIPLTGTTTGNPVTGDIEFISGIAIICKNTNENADNKAYITDNSFKVDLPEDGEIPVGYTLTRNGITTNTDFSSNPDSLDFVQRSYVEKPETLINTLNNCDSTQLDEIKTILGII